MSSLVVSPVKMSLGNNRFRRGMEKKRIQQLKAWHEDVKKIAKSEAIFVSKIFEGIFKEDDKDPENRDWIRSDEDADEPETDGKMVKKDA